MINEFATDRVMLTDCDSGPRALATIRVGYVHTTESPDTATPDNVAAWQQRSRTGSYHILVGVDGRTVRANNDTYIPWSAGYTANKHGLHISLIGYSARTREQWMSHPKQLETTARWMAHTHEKYGLPLVWLTAADLKAGKRGFSSHAHAAGAWGETDHTDPGPNFPHDWVLNRAREIVKSKGTPVTTPTEPAPSLDRLILDQLAGPGGGYPGWPQLGGRTVVDALAAIGEALKIDGFKAVK